MDRASGARPAWTRALDPRQGPCHHAGMNRRVFFAFRHAFFALLPLSCFGLLRPSPLRADNDWIGIEAPRPFDAGVFSVSERLSSVEYDQWEDGGNFYNMINYDGNEDIEDLLTLDTRLDWRASRRLYLELDVPTVFNEFSPYTGVAEYYNVGTPGVEESQGLGDMGLELRGAFKDKAPKGAGADAGWVLGLIAPTGLGPFDAQQTLAGTGAGRWQLIPGLVYGGRAGSVEGWIQARGRVQFGRQAEVSSQSYVDWSSSLQGVSPVAANTSLPGAGGGLWLGPRYGGDAVAGLSWIWYEDAGTRLGLACEGTAHWLSPWTTAAGPSGLPAEEYFVLTPELQARYGAYSAAAGWQARYIWAVEEPYAPNGELTFDVAYTF